MTNENENGESGPSPFVVSGVECIDLAKSKLPISTGVGFLDHMIDQLNSHAQIGVAVSVAAMSSMNGVTTNGNSSEHTVETVNRYADMDQSVLLPLCGATIGKGLRRLLEKVPVGAQSRFLCPLDEALTECRLENLGPAVSGNTDGQGKLDSFTLAPYGIFPRGKGRSKIGWMKTEYVEGFMRRLAQEAGLKLSLNKIRGDNGHHIVESTFKALSRALRNLIDGTNTNVYDSTGFNTHWGLDSQSEKDSLALSRLAKVERKTKETGIFVEVQFDGGKEGVHINTGIPPLDKLFVVLAEEAKVSLRMDCSGDVWIDDHHTSEDVAIALGQVLTKAFGTKAGLNRMWCANGTAGDAVVEVVMDLSNRPHMEHNLFLDDEEYVDGDLTVEMLVHVLESLVVNARMTVHVVQHQQGKTVLESATATFVAFGRALRVCAAVDPRRAGKTASSKGTLSV